MTSPPDVQNVPNVWRLLDRCYRVIAGSQGPWAENPGKLLNVIEAALAQRDRFVLVPKEPTEEMLEALERAYAPAEGTSMQAYAAALSAAPKPTEHRNADSSTATAEGQQSGDGEVGPPR